jgi:hypothetical protein
MALICMDSYEEKTIKNVCVLLRLVLIQLVLALLMKR